MMKKTTLTLFAAFVIGLASATDGRALARAFVSIAGNDNNACSAIAPCRTLTGAMANVLPGGEIVVVDSGLFGNVVIDKPVTIMGAPGAHAGVGFDTKAGTAVTIMAPAGATVVLRNLYITTRPLNQLFRGIDFLSGGALHIENCVVAGFKEYGIHFNIDDPSCEDRCPKLSIKDSFVRSNGVGIDTRPSAVIEHSRIEGNTTGVQLGRFSQLTIRDSIVATNSSDGLTVASQSTARVESCSITENGNGIKVIPDDLSPGNVYVANTLISGNKVGLKNPSGGVNGVIYSFRTNRLFGNGTDGNFVQIPQQ